MEKQHRQYIEVKAKADEAEEEIKCVALGDEGADVELIEIPNENPQLSIDQKIDALEQRIFHLTNGLENLFLAVKELREDINEEKDAKIDKVIASNKEKKKAEIPEGTVLNGQTRDINYFLTVKDGGFYIGTARYDSLSAAAEGVSGARRSGWVFWKLPNGKTVKAAYKE